MSGGWLPYHLRSNKAVDRAIFMEFLAKLDAVGFISNYAYIGFGGIHLEDFKLIHSHFALNDLTCIEIENVIHKRQSFNLPLACIKLENVSSDSFIANFSPEKNHIIWLDYASPEIGKQINEFVALLQKLRVHDVVKITLNANPNTLVDEKQFRLEKKVSNNINWNDPEELYQSRFEKLNNKVDDVPYDISFNMMNKKNYPLALLKILELNCQKAFENLHYVFLPILSFVYSDSQHQMLTLTGIVLDKMSENEFLSGLRLRDWEYFSTWDKPQIIDMPDLTLKERLMIDALLPCDNSEEIISKLQIQLDPNPNKSIQKINNYIRYYRHYPFFSRVSV